MTGAAGGGGGTASEVILSSVPLGRNRTFSLGSTAKLRVLAAVLLLGVVLGAVAGMYLYIPESFGDLESFISAKYPAQSLLTAFLNASQYLLLLWFFSTSYLGMGLAPLLLAVRGYLFGCSVSALYRCCSYPGLLASFLIQGIPALILTPCLLQGASACISDSVLLFRRRFGTGVAYDANRWGFCYIMLLVTVLMGTAYNYYLLPLLLNRVFTAA